MPAPITTVTIGGIVAKIAVDAEFSFSNGKDGPRRRVTYQLEGLEDTDTDAAAFTDALVGVGDYGTSIIGWPAPHKYPNNENLICLNAALQDFIGPQRPDIHLIGSDCVRIVADYGVPSWDGNGWDIFGTDEDQKEFLDGLKVPWCSVTTRGGFEEYAAKNLVAKVGGDALPSVKIRVPTVTYTIRRSMIPSLVDFDTLLSGLVGKVNVGVFCGKAEGTMSFEDWDLDDQFDAGGKRLREFTMQFRWRSIDWNKVLVPGSTTNWQLATDVEGGTDYLIEYADFAPLLTYGLV